MHLASYLGLLHLAELKLARAYLAVATDHGDEPDVETLCRRFADQSTASADPSQTARVRPAGSVTSVLSAVPVPGSWVIRTGFAGSFVSHSDTVPPAPATA